MKFEMGVIVLAGRNDGKLLFARRTYALFDYVLPGGGVDHGETPFTAAVREVREETGYLLDPESLLHLGTCMVPARKEVTLVVSGDVAGRADSPLSGEISTVGFFGADEIPSPITRAHRRCAELYFAGALKPGWVETIAMEEFELV